MSEDTPGKKTITVQCPVLLGTVCRRFTGTHFERQETASSLAGLDRLLVWDGEDCVALFPAGTWHAAWAEGALVPEATA